MGRRQRVAKSLPDKLSDLDQHLYILRDNLHRLEKEEGHLKVIAAELRVLLCLSSGTEGLLWRLAEELNVSDEVYLHVAGNVDTQHPMARGLSFALVPIQRGGQGDPQLPPNYYSLKNVIKKSEAVFISGEGLTHEYLIKAVAQQMGSAHEDEGIEPVLVDLGKLFINGVKPYVSILATDAELALQVGERIIEKAERERDFVRKRRARNYGDLSIIIRLSLKKYLTGMIPLFKFRSDISEVEIYVLAGPQSIVFDVRKKGTPKKEIYAQYPSGWDLNSDAVFIFSYSSLARQAHAITNGESQDQGIPCDIGWVHGNELIPEYIAKGHEELLCRRFVLLYERLLSTDDSRGIMELPPDGYGLWKFEDELEHPGVFPP